MMNLFENLKTAFAWKMPLIPSFHEKCPLYGPLKIKNYSKFLNGSKDSFQSNFFDHFPNIVSLDEFKVLHTLAEGAFGKVILVERKNKDKSLYAMKVIKKTTVVTNNCVTNILNEKRILQSLDCPFCVRLEYFCQSNLHLYLFLPFISGGDLFTHLHKFGRFQENLSKFYAAQVVLAFEVMHYCDIVHRDLKPENILIDHFGFVKIADFGFAKVLKSRTYTFCGTVDYAAPELIVGKGYGKAVDWWSLGVLLYEMSSGLVPFPSDTELGTFKKILKVEYSVPEYFSTHLKDLIQQLLVREPTKRLGNLRRGVEEIKSHSWFGSINWLELLNRKVVPPFIPEQQNERFSVVNFPNLSTKVSDLSSSRPSEFLEFFKDF